MLARAAGGALLASRSVQALPLARQLPLRSSRQSLRLAAFPVTTAAMAANGAPRPNTLFGAPMSTLPFQTMPVCDVNYACCYIDAGGDVPEGMNHRKFTV